MLHGPAASAGSISDPGCTRCAGTSRRERRTGRASQNRACPWQTRPNMGRCGVSTDRSIGRFAPGSEWARERKASVPEQPSIEKDETNAHQNGRTGTRMRLTTCYSVPSTTPIRSSVEGTLFHKCNLFRHKNTLSTVFVTARNRRNDLNALC